MESHETNSTEAIANVASARIRKSRSGDEVGGCLEIGMVFGNLVVEIFKQKIFNQEKISKSEHSNTVGYNRGTQIFCSGVYIETFPETVGVHGPRFSASFALTGGHRPRRSTGNHLQSEFWTAVRTLNIIIIIPCRTI